MNTINDVHLQFAQYFRSPAIAPYLYLLSQKNTEGSTCLDLSLLDSEVKEGFPFDLNDYTTEVLFSNDLVGKSSQLDRPFILDNNRLYLQRYFQYEIHLIEKIKVLVDDADIASRIAQLEYIRKDLERLFPNTENAQTDWQKIAAFFALINDFTIITGGPGTGKTTTVSKILELCLLLHPDASIVLAAPTGKAAARMAESLRGAASHLREETKQKFENLKPSTIHRLLGTKKNSIYFKHNHTNPIPADIIVIDECSMIDIALFSKLIDAVCKGTKLILLGDKDQLSSVEIGSLFGDLCKTVHHINHFSKERVLLLEDFFPEEKIEKASKPDFLQNNIIELTESRRFDKNKGIGQLSTAIIENDQSRLDTLLKLEDPEIRFDTTYSEEEWKKIAHAYKDYILEDDTLKALQFLDKQRILCAVREGEWGTYRWNQKIENYLFSLNLIQLDDVFYENRPIMVTQNNYELGLYNGDIGILRKKDDVMMAWFVDNENKETGLKAVLPGLISDMETVFAMTIHKSQGSEFDNVMIILAPSQKSSQLLTREILYTGITRAKKLVVLSADVTTIKEIAEKQVQRSSGVGVRL